MRAGTIVASATVREATTGVMAVTIGGRMAAMRDAISAAIAAISALRARRANRRRRVNSNPGVVNKAEAASAATVIVTAALASAKDSRLASRANLASRVQPSRRASRVRRANRGSRVRRHREQKRPLPQSKRLQVRYAKPSPAHQVANAKGAVVATVAGAVIAASRGRNERRSKAVRPRKSLTR